jgi:hypothetical protein
MADYRRAGYVNVAQGRAELEPWADLIDVGTVCLFGGEPYMNPDLESWILTVRELWPMANVKIITNGMFLHKKDILPVLFEVGNATLQVSLHWRDGPRHAEIKTQLIRQTSSHGHWQLINQNRSDIALTMKQNSVTVQLAVFGEFVQPYRGFGATMRPWNSTDTAASHSRCGSPNNPCMVRGRIYKCGPTANLKDILELHEIAHLPEWQSYLNYTGIGPNDNIESFVHDIGKPNPVCSMCSANPEVIDHYAPGSVLDKKEIQWVR